MFHNKHVLSLVLKCIVYVHQNTHPDKDFHFTQENSWVSIVFPEGFFGLDLHPYNLMSHTI